MRAEGVSKRGTTPSGPRGRFVGGEEEGGPHGKPVFLGWGFPGKEKNKLLTFSGGEDRLGPPSPLLIRAATTVMRGEGFSGGRGPATLVVEGGRRRGGGRRLWWGGETAMKGGEEAKR